MFVDPMVYILEVNLLVFLCDKGPLCTYLKQRKGRTMKALFVLILSTTMTYAVKATITFGTQSPISPLIYGYNQNHEDSTHREMNLLSRRLGGNRMSTFNWEENVENSGEGTNSSFCYIHGTILNAEWNDQFIAGSAYRKFHQDNLDAGLTSIITVPLLGWVAADKERTVHTSPQGADSLRWKELVYRKGSAFSLTPDTTDRFVYLDESINYLVQTFGDARTETGVKYISLGNEPGLWDNTHELAQEEPIGAAAYVDKVIEAAAAVKAVDPHVKIIAGEFAGINIYDLGSAPDWSSVGKNYDWFIAYLLDRLKQASDENGIRLIDILAVHNYPQHKVDSEGNFSSSGTVVRTSTSTEQYIRQTRMDFARSLWDTSYIEPSWITNSKIGGEPHNILGRLQHSIDTYFPGTALMFGEIDYGHNSDISHGIAIADMLGVMGNRGVEIVTRWELENKTENLYTQAAYTLFRNYDGNKSTFGDKAVAITFDSRDSASLWASVDSQTGYLHLIALNKSLTTAQDVSLSVPDVGTLTLLSAFGFDASSSTITERNMAVTSENERTEFTLPALSAHHLIFSVEKSVAVKKSTSVQSALIPVTSHKGTLHIGALAEKSTVTLFTVHGRQLFQEKTEGGILSTALPQGVYLLRVTNSLGTTVSRVVHQ